ncbi:hypothetical protein [Aeromicrobium marinum]|uniref:hypothetical protein n=1 Tax=Aeromicrobium marinum TaxID=219314 RepID=UPI00068120B0|nr:hypothetical protein [Aeromicrobium marinum]
MRENIGAGAALALVAAGTVLLGEMLGLELTSVALLGVALGGAVGLVPDRSHTERVLGFVAGLLVAWAGYGARAGVLPDSDLGRAVALAGVVLAVTVVTVVSAGRLPLWSLLTGVAALAGAYEFTFTANTPLFTTESVSAVTAVLLAAAVGTVATGLTVGRDASDRSDHRAQEVAR